MKEVKEGRWFRRKQDKGKKQKKKMGPGLYRLCLLTQVMIRDVKWRR
jgi:hypothetical protein